MYRYSVSKQGFLLGDLEVTLLDVGPEALEGLGAGDNRFAHDCLQRRRHGLRLGDAGRPLLLRGRLRRGRGLGRGGRRAHDECGCRAARRSEGGGGAEARGWERGEGERRGGEHGGGGRHFGIGSAVGTLGLGLRCVRIMAMGNEIEGLGFWPFGDVLCEIVCGSF